MLAGVCFCLAPFVSAPVALVLGILVALILGNPYIAHTRKMTSRCLAVAVIGLGAGMDLAVIGAVGLHGIFYTVAGIGLTLALGWGLGRWMRVANDTSLLIAVGTAICGGSAIAAIAPIIRARDHSISMALAIVFLLNAIALLIFPVIGDALGLSQHQFGLWAALAIHDTSSVVGATLQYGPQALETGTTVKLARALWIIPLAFVTGFIVARRTPDNEANTTNIKNTKKPWFILGFLFMAGIVTYIPSLQPAGHVVAMMAKQLLVATLFLIGCGMTWESLKQVGFAPLIQGAVLWAVMACVALASVLSGWVG